MSTGHSKAFVKKQSFKQNFGVTEVLSEKGCSREEYAVAKAGRRLCGNAMGLLAAEC